MNKELEKLILEYDAVSAGRDMAAEQANQIIEAHLDEVLSRHPGVTRENLRKSIKAHRKWVLTQETKPPSIPPRA